MFRLIVFSLLQTFNISLTLRSQHVLLYAMVWEVERWPVVFLPSASVPLRFIFLDGLVIVFLEVRIFLKSS